MSAIRIGTRGSQLAMWQAQWVARRLNALGHAVELIQVSTRGDVSTESLSQVGGQGVFTKEIQLRLLARDVDVAVHSLKDLPTTSVDGLILAAVPERETTRDCLISRHDRSFEQLPAGARIGTGSSRRGAQLLAWRNDVVIADIRGNVDSRLRKLQAEEYDAIILAGAGLARLNLLDHVCQILPMERMLPAIGQGALGLECRVGDDSTLAALAELNDERTHAAVTAERQLLASLQAGCLAPVAALASIDHNGLRLQARVMSATGHRRLDGEVSGQISASKHLGAELAARLLERGAAELIALARDSIDLG